MKIHFGCFDRPTFGWINTDITPHLWISRVPGLPLLLHRAKLLSGLRYKQHKNGIFRQVRYLDIAKRWNFESNTIEAIYSSHVLEHLYYDQGRNCLRECYRVLKPSGILRIVIPDLDRCIQDFRPYEAHEWVAAFFESQQARNKNTHHWMYNEHTLRRELQETGFSGVERCAYMKGKCPDLENMDTRPESLFMEAYK